MHSIISLKKGQRTQALFRYYIACKKSLKIIKGVIRIRKWKKRQHNGQKEKKTNKDLQNIHIKLKIE